MMKQVAVLGCGAWACAVSRLFAENVKKSDEFLDTVNMFVHEEYVNGENLAEVINQNHINPMYFPGFKIPDNVIASCDLKEVVSTSDILAIVYPTKHIPWLIESMKEHVFESSYFITFCKGVLSSPDSKSLTLISDLVREKTGRPCIAVIGATTAYEVAWQHVTEATIGSSDREMAEQTKRLLQTDFLRLTIVPDAVGVELCGALKHVVAIAAGIADGLNLGDNTRAAVLRLGFWELAELMKELFPDRGVQSTTVEQSCGFAELFVCMSHRSTEPPALGSDVDLMNIFLGRGLASDRRASCGNVPDAMIKGRSVATSGAELAATIYKILKERGRLCAYPLFATVHLICQQQLRASELINRLRMHPVHTVPLE